MSYSTPFARKFNRRMQRIFDTKKYSEIFPETKINGGNIVNAARGYLRNADEFEIVNFTGGFKTVGRGGALTGNPVDVMIFDDLYKDAAEGNSPVIRDAVIETYKSVAETRLHNDSQELCVFTRWHTDDLIGWFEDHYNVITAEKWEDFENIDYSDTWAKINFEAIKESPPTELDQREIGEPLFPQRHNLRRLTVKQQNDPNLFQCMYQGNPTPKEGLLYSTFKTYDQLPPADQITARKNYTDTADTGADFLASFDYVRAGNYVYIIDCLYTSEPMEKTEIWLPLQLERNGTKSAKIESNNGGRGFARVIARNTPSVAVQWFHQSGNKESRILTNAAQVVDKIIFPADWKTRWPILHKHLSTYKRIFSANKFDDAPDALTGIIEEEFATVVRSTTRPARNTKHRT